MKRIPREKRKYLKKSSDRSGFDYFKRELVKDGKYWVHPSEKDEPSPHSKYIGGEGDANREGMRSNRTAYPTTQAEEWADTYT